MDNLNPLLPNARLGADTLAPMQSVPANAFASRYGFSAQTFPVFQSQPLNSVNVNLVQDQYLVPQGYQFLLTNLAFETDVFSNNVLKPIVSQLGVPSYPGITLIATNNNVAIDSLNGLNVTFCSVRFESIPTFLIFDPGDFLAFALTRPADLAYSLGSTTFIITGLLLPDDGRPSNESALVSPLFGAVNA